MMNENVMGIIFPNMHDETIPELIAHRTMASVPFAGRYRMIDFCLSGMARAGMRNVGVIVSQNYQSLMDHLGNGREWDLSSKRGGLVIFPPFGREGNTMNKGRLATVSSVLTYLQYCKEPLVIMSDCDIAFNMDYSALVAAHRASGADVTAVYEKATLREGMTRDNVVYTLSDEGIVTDVRVNDYHKGVQNISMNVYVIGREFLIDTIKDSLSRNITHFEKDFLGKNLKLLKVCGYEDSGYHARIFDMQSYFTESLRLLSSGNLQKLFPRKKPIYTKVRDEAPVRYSIGAKATDSMVADGCIIEGTIENCVLFRGVRVRKGARLKNCVIMQGTEIQANVEMENVITDKNVIVGEGQVLRGAPSYPVFIAKGREVT